jgi:DNA-3-methyladenine glycosylase II
VAILARLPPKSIQTGLAHLRAADPVMGGLMDRTRPFQLRLERDCFRALVRSIVSQQISGRAAESIFRRLLSLFAPDGLSAERLARFSEKQLRGAGISPQKAAYLLDLAERVRTKQLRLDNMARLSDEAVIDQLVQVKGIGVWTAQMFLIFSLGRLDVFPSQDLGVRVALRNLYKLETMPDRAVSERIAAPWRPFATLASWYCWRSLELPAEQA